MSYVEHGPRIFLASRPNSTTPLIYGDYVLPKKRLEGRLKLHDSCSDIRAWSPNTLENSRYFRELSEHDSPVGKIVPFNVVIDNIIKLNSQVQNELHAVKRELQKYKSLKLTPKQEEQLQNLDNVPKIRELPQKPNYTTGFLKDAFLNINKSRPVVQSNSCLSIHIPCERYFPNNARNVSATRNQSNQLCSYPVTPFDVNPALDNSNFLSSSNITMKSLRTADYNEKTSWIEYVDVALQVERETRDVEVQIDDEVDKYLNKITTVSAMSQTSFTSRYSDEDNNTLEPDKSSLQTNNHEEQSFECDASCSGSSQDIGSPSEFDSELGTESDFNLHNGIPKRIIIEKESEIISLEIELCARDAELEELRETNEHLKILLEEKENCIHSQQGNLKILHEKLLKLDRQRNCEVDDLKQKFYGCKYLMDQLKQNLNEKCESCYLQSQEIEKLKLCAEKATTLQLEKDSLLGKLQEMEQLVEKAESYSMALEQLKDVLQEKDELKKQNYEQSCIIADQEKELNQLLKLIKEISVTYHEQMEAKNIIESLQVEIRDKNIKISQFEVQLGSMKREISDFFNNLKYALNNLEELNGVCEEVCSCTNCDLDIGEEANNILCNINIIMTRFQSYKVESQNLLQQIGDLKHYIENNKQQTYLNQNLENIICEDFHYDSEVDLRNTIKEDNETTKIVQLNVKQDKNNESEIIFKDLFNSSSISNEINNLNTYGLEKECHNYIIKLNGKDNIDETEKEIIEYFSHFLIKLHFLIQKLQIYAEIERPLIIKQTYYFYEILKDTQSAINISQDVTLKKQLISDLYNQHKEEYKKYNSYIKQLPNNLLQVQNKINEFIETILHQLLNEILCAEKKSLYDEKINEAFVKHLNSCINRINTVIQGAGDQRIQIAETIEEQQKELQKKNIEIAQLKEEVAQQLMRRGEGDCLIKEQCENNVAIKEQLSKVTAELNNKNAFILKLEEQLQTFKNELSTYNKDCNALKKENKNIENIKNRLLKESQQCKRQLITKNKEIKNLSQQVQDLLEIENLKNTLENKLKTMEKELINLQSENNELQKKYAQANTTISIKNDLLSQKAAEHENAMKGKHYEIKKLEDENKSLNEKLKGIENELIKMNQVIGSLTEQSDKIDIIHTMKEDLTKIDKHEKKLKIELNNLKAQLLNDQNNNKKLDNKLDIFQRENETLKKNIEYWKNETSELSIRLCNEVVEEKLKNKLYTLSNKIYENLRDLKEQFNSEANLPYNQLIKKLQDKYKIYQELKLTIDNVTNDLKSECREQRREMKENEIEEIEMEQLNSTNIKEETVKSNCAIFEQFNSSENNSLKTKNKIKYPENEQNKNQNKIEKLLQEIEIKDSEIRHQKETIKQLTQKNADLCAILKSNIQEYQDKLMLLKKNYDSSLNALCERHKANIEILQKQFEDKMRCERSFDSENWLQSLNTKELIELHERVNLIINSNSDTIHMKNVNQCFYDHEVQNQFCTKINEKKFQMLPTDMYDKELMQNKIVSSILEEKNTHLQNQWQFIASGDTQKYPTLQTREYKLCLEHNFGYTNNERKSPKLENNDEKEKETEKDSTFVQQRWNFINQCSAYHKLSNTYEY
ncbi:hypothetical protein ANTRET_LOCUS3368 [Anthophora retusa]